jgi:V8-like Glu-specific endopeptidase
MYRKIFVLSIILVLAFGSSSPALAISYGEKDGTGHPYVGSIVIILKNGDVGQFCSGTLISEDVFLTAAHCTSYLPTILEQNPGSVWVVTFDLEITKNGKFYYGTPITNPNYNPLVGEHDQADPGDVAVILLDKDPGITPARLPTAWLLDDLKAQHLLKDTLFTAVGYGTVRDTKQGGWQPIMDNLERNRADQEFHSLTDAWLTNSMNQATDNGGTCYGDSGGPHFIHLDGAETDIVASITVTGDAQCKASDKTYRIDTESALSFLAEYVTLP